MISEGPYQLNYSILRSFLIKTCLENKLLYNKKVLASNYFFSSTELTSTVCGLR